MSRRILLELAAVVLAISCFLAGCEKPQSKFRFAELPISYSAVTHIADAKGFYKAQNLNLFVLSVPAGPDIVASLRSVGNSGAYAGGIAVTPVITMIGANDQPVVLATTLDSDEQVQVVTFSKTQITGDPTSLRHKRIGVVRNTVGDIYLSRWLATKGVRENELIVVDGRPGDLRSLLVDGKLDAAILWDPYVPQAVQRYKERIQRDPSADRGEPRVIFDPALYHLAFNIVTTRAYLNVKRPELIALLKACIEAGKFINDDRHRSQVLLEQWLGLDSGDLDHFMATTRFDVHLDVPKMKLAMRNELEWLKTRQADTTIPTDLSPYVDSSLLESINPALVTH